MMWPEEGNTKDVARGGEYNWYGQKRENIKDLARSG